MDQNPTRGRPTVAPDKRAIRVNVTIPRYLLDALKQRLAGKSMSGEIARLIEREIKR